MKGSLGSSFWRIGVSKGKLITGVLLGLSLANAAAADFDPKFYFGAELEANQHNIPSKDPRYHKRIYGAGSIGAGVFVGVFLCDYLGLELGANALRGKKISGVFQDREHTVKFNITTKSKNLYSDLLGYFPMTEDLDLIASLGFGYLSTSVKVREVTHGLQRVKENRRLVRAAFV